jgi:MFS transporter, DHA3 family, macrolide efflux protein
MSAVGNGMKSFTTMWVGQLISLLGSGLTSFAMGIWVLDHTHSVTRFTLTVVFAGLPGVLIAPLAGALVDRSDRRTMLILTNVGSALCSLALFALLKAGLLEVWHIYIVVACNSVFNTFQWPALAAAITMLVEKAKLGRAAGMLDTGNAITTIAAPPLAGLLLALIGIWNLLLIDVVSFLFAIGSLLLVSIPNPQASAEGKPRRSLWREAAVGWQFIRQRQGLLALLIFFAAVNLVTSMCSVALLPMARGFASPAGAGLVMSMTGIGMLLGGLYMTATGGPRPRINGILGSAAAMTVCFVIIGARPSLPLVSVGVALFFLVIPIINGSSQAIWQSKVPPDLQGRVFAVRRMIAQFTTPIGDFSAGPLTDRVFQPLMVPGGLLAAGLGRWIGIGPGRGIALMFLVMAVFPLLIAVWGFANPRVRFVERDLPDAEVKARPAPAPAAAEVPAAVTASAAVAVPEAAEGAAGA